MCKIAVLLAYFYKYVLRILGLNYSPYLKFLLFLLLGEKYDSFQISEGLNPKQRLTVLRVYIVFKTAPPFEDNLHYELDRCYNIVKEIVRILIHSDVLVTFNYIYPRGEEPTFYTKKDFSYA